MNREMRRKERAERELKQLKADISNKVNIVYTHCKKRLAIFLSPEGMSLTKLFLARNY